MAKKQNVSCVIEDKRGRPISFGYNDYVKTNPLQAKYAKKVGRPEAIYIHAEIDAIIKAGRRIKDAYTIKIFRYDRKGRAKLACPCDICQEAIKHTPIKNIIYTVDEDEG